MDQVISAKIVADSIAPSGCRLTTIEATYPRFIHSELMTHRQFSRNAASSRAIPIAKMIDRATASPIYWGANQSGMQAQQELESTDLAEAQITWEKARQSAQAFAEELASIGLHKQIANRILEPFSWMTTIVSSTTWTNFFALRCHKDAQPEFRILAEAIRDAINTSNPVSLGDTLWHTPYIQEDEQDEPVGIKKMLSVARCARVSYLTQDGKREQKKDIELFERLKTSGHWSPFEHVAQALKEPVRLGNFTGWKQFRKEFPDECK